MSFLSILFVSQFHILDANDDIFCCEMSTQKKWKQMTPLLSTYTYENVGKCFPIPANCFCSNALSNFFTCQMKTNYHCFTWLHDYCNVCFTFLRALKMSDSISLLDFHVKCYSLEDKVILFFLELKFNFGPVLTRK
jgi:hypothetical protein